MLLARNDLVASLLGAAGEIAFAKVVQHDASAEKQAVGLAFPCPAMSGAVICALSKMAAPSPILPLGAIPSPPINPAQRSLTIVSIEVGQDHYFKALRIGNELHATVIDNHFIRLNLRILLGHLRQQLRKWPSLRFMMAAC